MQRYISKSNEIIDSVEARPHPDSDMVQGMRRIVWAMTAILAVSLGVNLWLAYKLGQTGRPVASQKPAALKAGAAVSPIQVQSLGGQPATISYNDSAQPVVLYVFTPQCSWCIRNLDNLKALTSQKGGSYKFIGISLTDKDLKQYLAEKEFSMPVFMNPAKEAMQQYGLGPTPQTIVISPDGKVLQNWMGAYAGKQQGEVEKFFGITLPGLAPQK